MSEAEGAGAAQRPFRSELVFEETISEATLRAYHVGFDENAFRLKPLLDVIMSVLPEFAFGFHAGTVIPQSEIVNRLREAASTIYTTEEFRTRGEFGELILHLLLRDWCNTVPLVSKIYFKDSVNVAVHGFDAVHVSSEGNTKTLWLGESKLYGDGFGGVKSLAKDVEAHMKGDYLRSEFSLISRRVPTDIPGREHWLTLMHNHQRLATIYQGVCIPAICTYTSPLFGSHKNKTEAYLQDFQKEIRELKETFDRANVRTDLEVLLMLLPVPSKDVLVAELDKRLRNAQDI